MSPGTGPKTLAFDIEGILGTTVTFNNLSENVTEFEWTFGDGHGSQTINPVHEFESSGQYTPSI